MKKSIVFVSLTFLLILVISSRGNSQDNAVLDADVLVYSVFDYDDGTTLYLYDTSNDESTILYQDAGRLHFAFGSNGLVAFSTDWTWENNGELFVLDTTELDQPLVNLSQEIDRLGYPLGWSDDSSYLAFASETNDGRRQAIYVWDWTRVIDITPQNTLGNPQSFDIDWSPDGRLAFTVWYGSSSRDPRSEIYLWDGEATLNLSQNADTEDREPVWNANGELVFGSLVDNETVLFLWDGISYDDGLPDVTSFARVAPQLHVFSPFSAWVSEDHLAFEVVDSEDSLVKIYVWDKRSWSNISQIPDVNSYTPRWSQAGYWAFVTDQQRLYIRDELNDTVFETYGQSPAWSSGGSLAFCSRDSTRDWKLSRWNRRSVSTLIQGQVIYAQWRSGQNAVCSDG